MENNDGMQSFSDFKRMILESDGPDGSFIEALTEFLEREGIYGFEQEITSILMGTPSKDALNDIEKSFFDAEGIDVRKADVLEMNRKSLLERYLELKGVNGYTEAILDLWGQYRKEGNEKVIKVKDKPLYHLKPSNDTLRIWCWDTPELEGVPKLISVSDLYGVDRFSQTNPAAYEYIKK